MAAKTVYWQYTTDESGNLSNIKKIENDTRKEERRPTPEKKTKK